MNTDTKREILKGKIGKVALHCAGEKMKKMKPMEAIPSVSRSNVIFPHLYINSKQMPELKGKEVNEEIKLVISGKITSHTLNENKTNSNEDFSIEIQKIGLVSK